MLRAAPRRLSRSEVQARVEAAPDFVAGWIAGPELDQLVAGYEAITGVRVRSFRKRDLIAATSRTWGPLFLDALQRRLAESGTETNLLADLRSGPPRSAVSVRHIHPEAHWSCPCAEESLLTDVIYCAAHRPLFDPTSKRRYDRHPSNPAAARFFPGAGGSG